MLSSLLDALPRPPAEAPPLLVRAGRPGLLLSVATELLERCFEEGAHAETLLRRRFREDHRLGSKDRAILKDGLYATLRRHESAALLLRLGGWDGDRAPLALWLAQLVREGGLPPEIAAETFGAPIFEPLRDDRASLRAWAESTKPDDVALLAIMGSLPRWLAAAWLEELGPAEAARLVSALAERAPIGLRANRLKTDRDRARAALAAEGIPAEPGALAPDALLVRESANVAGGRAFREGLVEIQDEGSQLIAAMVEPPPKGLIVDFCAGAGGKSLAIAPKLRDRQRLWAFDVRADAIKRARQRAARAGTKFVRFDVIPADGPLPVAPASAVRVLVDAPCSGTGTLRRHPSLRQLLRGEDRAARREEQLGILTRAATLAAPGARVVYATCSLLRAENQGVVEAFLLGHPGWRLLPLRELWGEARAAALGDGESLVLTPHRHGTDGFFAAVLVAPG